MGRGSLARAHERRVQHERYQSSLAQATTSFYGEAKFHESLAKSMERGQARAEAREAAQADHERQEREREAALAAAWEAARHQQEADQAAEEAARRAAEAEARNKLVKKASIQRSHELRELRQKLMAASVVSGQAQQLVEALDAVAGEEHMDDKILAQMALKDVDEGRKQAQQQAARAAQAQALHDALQLQMQDNAELRRAAKEEAARERQALQDLVQRWKNEDEVRKQDAANRKRSVAVDIAAAAAAQRELRERQRAAEAEESRKIEEYMRRRREKEDREASRRAAQRNARDEAWEAARKAAEDAAAAAEEEEALLELLQADLELQRAQRAVQEETARRQEQRKELQAAQQVAEEHKRERAAMEAAHEADFRRRLVERLAEEDRVEKLNAAAKRAAVAAHLREAERCMAYRRRLMEAIKVSKCTCHEAKFNESYVFRRETYVIRNPMHCKFMAIVMNGSNAMGFIAGGGRERRPPATGGSRNCSSGRC